MTDLTAAEIEHLAKLARLQLSDDEKSKFSRELPKIVDFVDQLRGVKIETVADGQPTVRLSELRDDAVSGEPLDRELGVERRLTLEQLEKLAPIWEKSQVAVPPVFGDQVDV